MTSRSSPPFQGHQDLVGSDWQLAHPYAAGIEDGVGDRSKRGDDAGFGNADHDLAIVAIVDDENHFRNLERAGQLVIAKSGVELQAKLRVNDATFPKGHAQ